MNYWGYRIDTTGKARDYFRSEIEKGWLRQGWGYNESQDLSKESVDESAKRNLPIYNRVKKGDFLLVPHLDEWDEIMIVRATKDFCEGYEFDLNKEIGDYGHKFPVERIKVFNRHNTEVPGDIRETFKCRCRFWNINRCENSIEKLISVQEPLLRKADSYAETFKRRAIAVLDVENYANDIYNVLNEHTQASEWEQILCEGFKQICPEGYDISTTSNRVESEHGADIVIRIPGILDGSYVIAIQVKDYQGFVNDDVLAQIQKAKDYFKDELIDTYVIITKAKSEDNTELLKKANKMKVKIVFDDELKRLLVQMAKAFIGSAALE